MGWHHEEKEEEKEVEKELKKKKDYPLIRNNGDKCNKNIKLKKKLRQSKLV